MGMNPDVKAQWVAALRSGEYAQGREVLHSTEYDSYCCLGVLCDVAVKSGLDIPVDHMPAATFYGEKHCTLPAGVMEWAGLDEELPGTSIDMHVVSPDEYDEYDEGAYPANLANLNDLGWSFEQIADVIEAEF
jgi:hypothetical protein